MPWKYGRFPEISGLFYIALMVDLILSIPTVDDDSIICFPFGIHTIGSPWIIFFFFFFLFFFLGGGGGLYTAMTSKDKYVTEQLTVLTNIFIN